MGTRIVLLLAVFAAGAPACSGDTAKGGADGATVADVVGDAGEDGGGDASRSTTDGGTVTDGIDGAHGEEDAGTDVADEVGGEEDAGTDSAGDGADATPDVPSSPDVALDTGPDASAPCVVDFDCAPGLACLLGECAEPEPPCASDDDCGDLACTDGVCVADGASPLQGSVIINELLTDGSADEDANGDGTVDALEDELVELVNVSNQAVDLSGWTLVEADFSTGLPRHTFPPGTVLQPKGAIVIFGGGDAPAATATVSYVVANAADPGIPFGLDLDDAGDTVRLLDAGGLLVALAAYGDGAPVPATSDQSLTRSPDLTGAFVPHTTAAGAEGASMSPGSRADGGPF